jgi:hypothetical protein
MIALAALMENTATKDSFKKIAMPDTSVISEQLPGKMKTRSAKRVTIVPQALYFQLGVPRHSTGLVPVQEMSHTANPVRLDTTASIMTVYHVSVPKVISVPKRQRSQFHVGRVTTIRTSDRKKILTAWFALLELLAIVEVSTTTSAICALQVIIAPRLAQKTILFLALQVLTGTQQARSHLKNVGNALLATSVKKVLLMQHLVTLVTTALKDQLSNLLVVQAFTALL